jgi:SAM-dependent methyltransferase
VYGQRVHTCPACGGALADWRSVPSAEPELGPRRFELLRCRVCASAVTAGEPLPEFHDAGAYGGGTPRLHALARRVLARFDRRRLELVRELAQPPARLLDAGAGRGRFVAAARAAGYDAFGIEPSVRGTEAAAALGVDVRRAGLEDAEIEQGSVDAATLWHVLEHLDEPAPALDRLHGWLRPGGGLLVGVPNLASWQARLGGARWYHLDVPRHRIHFTPAGLSALLGRHGFQVVRAEHRLLEHNPFGMWQSAVTRGTRHPSYLYNLLKRNAPLDARDLAITLAALPLAPVAAAIESLAARTGHGGTIAVVARAR